MVYSMFLLRRSQTLQLTGGDDVVTIRGPVSSRHPLEMSLQEHDALPRPQVPNPAEAVQPSGDSEGPVLLEADAVDLLAVALLVEDLGQLLQVPQSPAVVPHRGGQEAATGMVGTPRHPSIVTLNVRQRLLAVQTPELDR